MAHWPESYRVSALPQDHPWLRYFSLTVEYWKEGLWMICDGSLNLDVEGNYRHPWDFESRDEFIDTIRYTRERALEIAEKIAPLMTANGMTVQEVLAKDPKELR